MVVDPRFSGAGVSFIAFYRNCDRSVLLQLRSQHSTSIAIAVFYFNCDRSVLLQLRSQYRDKLDTIF
ncbi:hypothetical protein IQ272_11000 [Chroococcidiopsidales cyanobacterium LEGE 13417]|uniref:hypothetical protein n=1 Tax=Chroococcidiopsis sp. CCALA 051 TaxID=869949 RepID=UPI0011B24D25|nr:hypothetical protein [Chroococcidiopsis sp. CCALA 051]MBE9016653.1 hypothetical protein [Chroococcidiopsidales cyanobacterium LEGE 13417]